jgi:hypothetical protein
MIVYCNSFPNIKKPPVVGGERDTILPEATEKSKFRTPV